MTMDMDFRNRSKYLQTLFSYDKTIELDDKKTLIRSCSFTEECDKKESDKLFGLTPDGSAFCTNPDNAIKENSNFRYSVFLPNHDKKYNSCIILLHGLNERSWDKYLTWAEYLCKKTGKPVILFPIAFHMNRTPDSWYMPRQIVPWVKFRKDNSHDTYNSTFANVALSLRLSANPIRLYTSGRETILNLRQLLQQIKEGRHSLFVRDTKCDFFAYSIGAMVSQVLFISNPDKLISDSRFFLFCGGSIFEKMNGSAREIMDNEAWSKVYNYYSTRLGLDDGFNDKIIPDLNDELLNRAFMLMLKTDLNNSAR